MIDPDWPAFEAWAERLLVEADAPGAAVALWRDGAPVYAAGIGYRDREAGMRADEDTVFGTGSVTKSFTALAIMQLTEAGKLALHDPLTTHLPELKLTSGDAGAITIHHLLTHTAGFPPLPGRHYAALHAMNLDEGERAEID